MKTAKNLAIATLANDENIFDAPLELMQDKVTVEIVVSDADAATRATLKTSASGQNFSTPHDDAVIEIEAGDSVVNVPFEGLTPGTFVEVHFDKLTATTGTLTAAIV